jgi:hypothetical protein
VVYASGLSNFGCASLESALEHYSPWHDHAARGSQRHPSSDAGSLRDGNRPHDLLSQQQLVVEGLYRLFAIVGSDPSIATDNSNANKKDNSGADRVLAHQQMVPLRSVYQRLTMNPIMRLDQCWQEYEAFEWNQSEVLAQALLQESAPKSQQACTVYLECNRVYAADLQLHRLATPPAEETDVNHVSKMEEEKP